MELVILQIFALVTLDTQEIIANSTFVLEKIHQIPLYVQAMELVFLRMFVLAMRDILEINVKFQHVSA
jgi:hypothetical protein